MELRPIADGVFACLQKEEALGRSNSGLIARGGGLVVDTFWDLPLTRQLIAEYARVHPEPARRVVNTHHNGDHCWGNQLFESAEIIGHRLCVESFGKEDPRAMQSLKQFEGTDSPLGAFADALRPFDFTGIVPTPPTTVIEDRLHLDLDGIAVEVLYVGPAHTAGDVLVHLPEQGVLFAGDVLFRLCTPIGWEGTTDRWCAALDRIVELAPETIVPGHGPLCGVEGAIEMKQYLQYVRSEARHFFDRGVSEVDAALAMDLGPYASWAEPERLVMNLGRAYREFRGEPWDAKIDVAGVFAGMGRVREVRWGRR